MSAARALLRSAAGLVLAVIAYPLALAVAAVVGRTAAPVYPDRGAPRVWPARAEAEPWHADAGDGRSLCLGVALGQRTRAVELVTCEDCRALLAPDLLASDEEVRS